MYPPSRNGNWKGPTTRGVRQHVTSNCSSSRGQRRVRLLPAQPRCKLILNRTFLQKHKILKKKWKYHNDDPKVK